MIKKMFARICFALLILNTFGNIFVPQIALASSANISVTSVDGVIGSEVTVEIRLANATNVSGFELELEYDPSHVEVTNIRRGNLISNGDNYLFFSNPQFTGSRLKITGGSTNPERIFLKGSGTIATVTFKVKGEKQSSLRLRNVIFSGDSVGNISNGTVRQVITATGVTLSKSSLSLDVGQSERLTATVTPANATNKNINWRSSNTNVATVDSNGNVKAVGPGSANISATTQSGNKVATASVNVTARVTGVSIQGNSTILINTSNNLTANITPSNANNKKVTWSSSDTSVATVDNNGRVTGVKAGEATITVITEEGNRTATMKVKVVTTLPVEGISVANSEVSIVVGEVNKNTVEFKPDNASNKGLSFESSDTSIVIVDAEGNFRGLVPGEATITVTSADGGHKASFKVIVNPRTGDEAVSTFNPILVNENTFVFPAYILLGENDLEFTNDDFSMVLGRDVIQSTLKENGQENAEYFTIIVNKVQHGTPSGFIPLSPVYEFFLEVDGNKIKNFNGEIVKEFYFDKMRELNLENVSVYWFNPDTDAWEVVPSEIDSEAGVVRAKLNHWSRFILMEDMNSITGGDKKPLGTGGLLGFIFLSLVVGFAGGFFSKDIIVSKVGKKTRTM
ncbi:Ig-like domain-containing protein [Alkalicella caledoniensis]|uniref:Ig-like domain-containing protein n=1 Tax=Alkalicella caledoniensis TaxID=2731377 RepID=A0A7G9WCX8_ALKCA|nr:Ig-like domain-containing protein [Alkalicella caledoniensis]QNO16540.1 Ig-like domain-containing protein [Alkalicella caledoniensis]